MPRPIFSRTIGLLACCVSLAVNVMPVECAAADSRTRVQHTLIRDIELGPAGEISGHVLTPTGQASAGVPVQLYRDGKLIRTAVTNQHGQFVLGNRLRGGLYAVGSPGSHLILRAWVAGTAPPAATSAVLLTEETVARGQIGTCQDLLYECFERHPAISYVFIATAIAVPIIVINDRKDAS